MGVIDASIVFASRAEFCRDISDVVAPYTALARAARKSNRPNRRAKDHLRSAFGAGSIEWILNIGRIGEVVSPSARKFMRFGTTGSDATNSELKSLRRGISPIHASILRAKLRVSQISNLIAVTSSLNNPTSIQTRKRLVIRRLLHSWSICIGWDIWRSDKAPRSTPGKTPSRLDAQGAQASSEIGRKGRRNL